MPDDTKRKTYRLKPVIIRAIEDQDGYDPETVAAMTRDGLVPVMINDQSYAVCAAFLEAAFDEVEP